MFLSSRKSSFRNYESDLGVWTFFRFTSPDVASILLFGKIWWIAIDRLVELLGVVSFASNLAAPFTYTCYFVLYVCSLSSGVDDRCLVNEQVLTGCFYFTVSKNATHNCGSELEIEQREVSKPVRILNLIFSMYIWFLESLVYDGGEEEVSIQISSAYREKTQE